MPSHDAATTLELAEIIRGSLDYRWKQDRALAALDELLESLAMLRSAWNAHMETCPQHAALPDLPAPTWADLERWRNAPSNTAAGGVLQPNEALSDEARRKASKGGSQ